MRVVSSWPQVGLALALLAACAPGDRSIAPTEPPTSSPKLHPAALTAPTILLQETFEDSAFAARGWYDNSSMATTTAQHADGSTRALEVHFLPGATAPTWGGAARHLFPATPTLYVSYWVKYSPNWVGSAKAYHPHEFLVLSDLDGDWDGPSNNWLTLYLEHNYQNGGIPRMALQDNKAINTSLGALPLNLTGITESRSIGGCNGVVEANVVATCFNMPPWYNDKELSASQPAFKPNPGPGYKGDWNHVEAYYQLNSVVGGIGQPDGVMQYWFNDALVIDRHDILLRTGARPNIQFHQFLIAPYIGDGSPVDQTMWVDNLTVATSRDGATPAPSAAVASVAVTPGTVSQNVGATQQLVTTLKDASGNVLTGRPVVWTSSAPTIATVNDTGFETGVAPGTATITATSEGQSGTTAITVTATKPAPVTTLSVATVANNSVTLSFTEVNDGTGKPASYDVRSTAGKIAWGSAKEISQGTCQTPIAGTTIGALRTCTVLGLAPSTSYQFQLIAFRGTLNVNAVFGALSNVVSGTTGTAPVAPVASVTVTPPTAGLIVGATQQLTTVLKDASGAVLNGRVVTWASTNPTVATVSGSGLVTGVGAGAATITATSEGIIGTAAVSTISVAVATVTLSPASATLTVGATQPLVAALKDASGNTLTGRIVTWTSSSPAAATVSTSGLVTGVGAGTATITATSEGMSGSAALTVTLAPVASVTVTPGSVSLLVGATQQLTATLKDAGGTTLAGRTVTWGSSNPAAATVGTNGLVTGVLAGTATITATSEGKSGSATVTVTATATKPGTVTGAAVAGVTTNSVTLSFAEVNDGAGQPASYDVRWAAGAISWGSATEVAQGTCKVPMAGTAIGAARTCTVLGLAPSTNYQFQIISFRGTLNVNAVFGALSNVVNGTTAAGPVAPVASVSVSPASASVAAGQTAQFTATPRDASGNALTGRVVTWASSNTAIATVSGSGLATGAGTGSATVTAASEGKSGTATITVTAALPPPPPPPPPSGGTWPNEPAGYTTVTDFAFDNFTSSGWNTNPGPTIATDQTAPRSPNNVAQWLYPQGFGAGSSPGTVFYPASVTDHYVGYYFKYSNPYSNQVVGTKQWYPYGSSDYFVLFNNGSHIQIDLQVPAAQGGSYNLYANVSDPAITLGVWHRFELLFKRSSSPSTADGIVRWWIDGVLCGNYTNVMWPSTGFDELRFAPTWGGIGGTVAFNSYWWVDHIHISKP